jgi:hypothetical protein
MPALPARLDEGSAAMPHASPSQGLAFFRPRTWLAVTILFAVALPAAAKTPLHQRIDQQIEAARPDFARIAAPQATDAEFLRRLYLDLTGTIPTAGQVRVFLADQSAGKRAQLIDSLLSSPEYARNMQQVFDVLLMERRPDVYVPRAAWQEYLRQSFAANKPLDILIREILSADGTDPKTRPAAKFFLDRAAEPHVLTRDIGRLFLGMNLQCAQCHDHPLINSYHQADYYGLFAFLNRSFLFRTPAGQFVLAEKAEGEASFQSVFDPTKVTKTTGPHVPGGPPVKEVKFEKGKEYAVAPAPNVRPVPKFSRRAQLAGQITSKEDLRFRRNLANRLWALLMGRGLVHPLDLDHADNQPSHPKLLTLLADHLAARKFDVKDFLRELALSKTYQRSSELPKGVKKVPADSFAVATLKPLSPEQLAWALMQATGLTDAQRRALGKRLTEQTLYQSLAGNVAPFAAKFGGRPGKVKAQSFEATLDQTLFLANGSLLRGWLGPRPGNLADRLQSIAGVDGVAEELYLSILTRRPSAEETKDLGDYLKGRTSDRAAALQELAWALMASAEFRFNH